MGEENVGQPSEHATLAAWVSRVRSLAIGTSASEALVNRIETRCKRLSQAQWMCRYRS